MNILKSKEARLIAGITVGVYTAYRVGKYLSKKYRISKNRQIGAKALADRNAKLYPFEKSQHEDLILSLDSIA